MIRSWFRRLVAKEAQGEIAAMRDEIRDLRSRMEKAERQHRDLRYSLLRGRAGRELVRAHGEKLANRIEAAGKLS